MEILVSTQNAVVSAAAAANFEHQSTTTTAIMGEALNGGSNISNSEESRWAMQQSAKQQLRLWMR